MANVEITRSTDGMQIRVGAVGDEQARLLETISGCADGQCACANDEYQKVASMDLRSDDLGITIAVRVKPGEAIDPACVTECLGSAD